MSAMDFALSIYMYTILYSRLFWRALKLANWSKMLLANFNLANVCVPHATPLRTIMCAIMHHTRARARVFGGINFGDLLQNSSICQIKIPAKVSGYAVFLDPQNRD